MLLLRIRQRCLSSLPGHACSHHLIWPACLAGPGDARPTAAAIVADEKMVDRLAGKVILITGCSSGIGIETARALHATGAHLFLTARDVPKAQEVANDILKSNGNATAKVDVLKLDLDCLQSVRECASSFLSKSKQLNILINNAGKTTVMLVISLMHPRLCMFLPVIATACCNQMVRVLFCWGKTVMLSVLSRLA